MLSIYTNFSLLPTLPLAFMAMDTPESVLSKIHPRCVTLVCCLMFMSFLQILISSLIFSRLLVPNTIDLVLSSPKRIPNLLSANQSQMELKFLFRFSSIHFKYLSVKIRQESSAYRSKFQSTDCLHIKGRSGVPG